MTNKRRDSLWTLKSLDVKCNYGSPHGQKCGDMDRYCCWICFRLDKCVARWKLGFPTAGRKFLYCPRSRLYYWCSAAYDHYLGES